LKAVIYARYSPGRDQREESIEGQVRECKEYAEQNGLSIIEIYADRKITGRNDQRPEFQRMLEDSKSRQFEVVLIWKFDRFARNRYEDAINKHALKERGIRVVSAKEKISDTPEGIILESMLVGMSEYYSANLSQNIRRGLTENALKGVNNGSRPPLGYRINAEKKLEPNPTERVIVQEIFQRYADGEAISAIASSLNERGLRTRTGRAFNNNSSLHKMLKNRVYIGEYKYMDIVIPNSIEPIISNEIFDAVQMRLSKNKRAPAMSKAVNEFVLTTKLFCGCCGKAMVGESGTSKTGRVHYYYKCGKSKRKTGCVTRAVRKEWIERYVVQKTMELALNEDVITHIADLLVAHQNKENAMIPSLKKQLRDTEGKIKNFINAIEEGIVTSSTKKEVGGT
jgi:Site-specific recombinases, DNA invertase Pin homologs